MITDNTAALFAPNPTGPALAANYRVGVLLAFDADDGSNTVGIGTAELNDLPLLVTGAEIGLESGDNVLVMYLGNSAMIVGKIASVGGPNYGAANIGRISLFNDHTPGGFGAPVDGLVPVQFTVPGWANSMLVSGQAGASFHNGSSTSNVFAKFVVADSVTNAVLSLGTQYNVGVTASFITAPTSTINSLIGVSPGQQITLSLSLVAVPAIPTDSGGGASLEAAVQFFREGT